MGDRHLRAIVVLVWLWDGIATTHGVVKVLQRDGHMREGE